MTEPIDTPPAPPPTEIVPISAPSMKPVSGSVMLRVLLVAVSVAFVWILLPFYGTILWGAIIALLFAPLNRWLLPRMGQRRTLAALVTMLAAIVISALAAVYMGFALVDAGLALVSLALIFMVLYSRYQSARLALLIMGNIPMALIGSVIAMWLAGVSLSVATMVGFITLAGIATRNGILKISHYINLCRVEGETFGQAMIVRGSLERLTPVLMTALVAAFALTPLLLAADAPGKEILHPVAVVIFGGLVSSTLLDTVLTPLLFWLLGRRPLDKLLEMEQADGF